MILTEQLIWQYIDKASSILSECSADFVKPYIINVKISRARSFFGRVTTTPMGIKIDVSSVFNEITDPDLFDERLTSCMIHELIHTIPGCMNHKGPFQHQAYLVNKRYPQYKIQTSTYGSDYGIQTIEKPDRYIVRCFNCGYEWRYKIKPRIWADINKSTSRYRCSCGGKRFIGKYIGS